MAMWFFFALMIQFLTMVMTKPDFTRAEEQAYSSGGRVTPLSAVF